LRDYEYDVLQRANDMTYGATNVFSRLLISPQRINFGTVNTETSRVQSVHLFNPGSSLLTITTLSNSDPASILLDSSPPFEIATGESRTIAVTFSPSDTNALDATLTIESSNGQNTSVVLTGQGNDPQHRSPEPILNLGAVASDQRVDLFWDIFDDVQEDFSNFHIYRDSERITTERMGGLTPIATLLDRLAEGFSDETVFNNRGIPFAGPGTTSCVLVFSL